MEEYCCSMEEDWDLQAIVRGCTHDQYTTNSSLLDYNYHDDDDDHFYDFQELDKSDYSLIVNELDDLYKPFYDSKICNFSPQLDDSDSSAEKKEVKIVQEDLKVLDHKQTAVVARPSSVTPTTKYKRKHQQKRVVVQVTAEGLSSDLWAWRKYGQKPIKGSPYPRSYYRCSSSKGCLARKQVEESCSDPGMFIITYSAEHNHSHPTRRSSLAGTNRQKSSALKRTTSGESCVSSSSTTTKVHLNSSKVNAGQVQAYKKIKHEKYDHKDIQTHEKYSMDQDIDDHEFIIPDSILTDDFHKVLEDLDGLISNSSLYSCASQ